MPTFSGPSMTACILALSSALTFAAIPAKAAENSFSIPTQATTAQGGANGGVAIGLPPAGTPSFFMNFVLPRDYAKNEKISIVLFLSSAVAPCIVRIVTPQIVRYRRNAPPGFDLAGLDEGNPNIKIGDDLIVQKIITIGPGDQLNGQRAGDAFSVQFRREADDPIDTCNGNVFVQAIDIRYPI